MEHEEPRHRSDDDAPQLPSDEEGREFRRLAGQLDALKRDIELARRDLVRASSARFEEFFKGPRLPRRPAVPVDGERVELRDGSIVVVRPLEPTDSALVEYEFANLSAVNRYRQFLPERPEGSGAIAAVDADHFALGAIDPGTGAGVGLARYVRRAADPARATVAVIVVDAWQGRGLATRLLERLAGQARANAIERFDAHMLAGDTSTERMLARVGTLEAVEHRNGVLDVTVRLAR